MGTGYKGNSRYYRSIGQNILLAASKYDYKNGRFGDKSPHGGNDKRNISSADNLATAADFYNMIAFGGREQRINSNLKLTRMADGTVISMRKVSSSDGTPVVEINIKSSTHTGGVKNQKIHFVEEKR